MRTYHVRVFNETQTTKFDSEIPDLKPNEYVIVETATGSEWGVVADEGTNKKQHEPNHAQIFRRATTKDQSQINLLLKSAEFAKEKAVTMAEQLKLDMRIMSAHYTFDASKVIIDFSAEQRVDFRELVRNLASALRTRIELHQIGARDEVKAIGALGPCGQVCCCKRFCHNCYPDVSIKIAKQQNISLTPEKINGVCGRLKCCLSYECDK